MIRPDEKLFTALARSAERRLSEFNVQNLANTAWAFATVNRPDEKLFTALARAAEQRVSEFNVQDLANMAWACACLDMLGRPLSDAISRAVLRYIDLYYVQRVAPAPTDFVMGILGVIWAFNFAEMLSMDFYWAVRKILVEIGREIDQQQKSAWSGEVGDGRLREGFRTFGVPHVELDLPDRFVVHKPPGWEVDTIAFDNAKPNHLSRYLQRVLG